MEPLMRAMVSNAALVSILSVVVLIVDRLAHRPALSHRLLLLLMVKLITPPLWTIELPWGRADRVWLGRALGQPEQRQVAAREPPATQNPASRARGVGGSPLALQTPPSVEVSAPAQVTAGTGWRRPFWLDVIILTRLAGSVWLSMAAIWALWLFRRLVQVGRRLNEAVLAGEQVQLRALELADCMNLRRTPRVWLLPETISPMIWTTTCDVRLVLPESLWNRLDASKRDGLLVHELAHLKRLDHWVRWLELVLASIYWWFPVLSWIRRNLHDAEERCCDAWVVSTLPEAKKAYAEALLDTIDFLAEGQSITIVPLGASSMIMGVPEVKERLGLIMSGKSPYRLSTWGVLSVAGVAAFVLPLSPARREPRYTIRDLGTLGTGFSIPLKLNDRGQVLGQSPSNRCKHSFRTTMEKESHFHAFLTRPDLPINPETDDLGLNLPVSFKALGLNNRGQVVGYCETHVAGATQSSRAFLVERGQMVELGALPDDHFLVTPTDFPTMPNQPLHQVRATAINDRGQITGYDQGFQFEKRKFLTAPNHPIDDQTIDLEAYDGKRDYGAFDSNSRSLVANLVGYWMDRGAPQLNERGQVIGWYFDARPQNLEYVKLESPPAGTRIRSFSGGPPPSYPNDVVPRFNYQTRTRHIRGFRTAPNRPINPDTDDLGFLDDPPRWTIPHDINIHGQVVGNSGPRAFRTAPNRSINPKTDDLGPFDALAINDAGLVVGRGESGFLHDGTRLYDLNNLIPRDSSWRIYSGEDINNRGQILAAGIYSTSGEGRALLLDPVPDYRLLSWLFLGTTLTGFAQIVRWKTKQGAGSLISA
jgi:probable HAF family extracellular repeat protein